jgi:hypothetical protein
LTLNGRLASTENVTRLVTHIDDQWISTTLTEIVSIDVQDSTTFDTATVRRDIVEHYSEKEEGKKCDTD